MSFLGNSPNQQQFIATVDYFNGNGSTVAFTLSRTVAASPQVQVVVANVPQNPSTAFTVLGNTITFTSAPPSGTNNIYVYYTSPIVQSVTASGSGGVQTNVGAPAFRAYINTAQVLSLNTNTKLRFNAKVFDTNTNFDATTNYRFTPMVAGYYQVNLIVYEAFSGSSQVAVWKNGSADVQGSFYTATGVAVTDLVYLNGSTDYIEAYYYGAAKTISQTFANAHQFSAAMIRSA